MFFKFGGSRVCGRARRNGQRFLGASRAVVCIEAAGSVRCVWGARADAGTRVGRLLETELAYIDILVNSKIRLDSVKRMTQIQNTS